jgi:hypothetical protein
MVSEWPFTNWHTRIRNDDAGLDERETNPRGASVLVLWVFYQIVPPDLVKQIGGWHLRAARIIGREDIELETQHGDSY